MSLHLGDEVFDIGSMPMQGSFNHLFIRQGTGLLGQSMFRSKMSFRSVAHPICFSFTAAVAEILCLIILLSADWLYL